MIRVVFTWNMKVPLGCQRISLWMYPLTRQGHAWHPVTLAACIVKKTKTFLLASVCFFQNVRTLHKFRQLSRCPDSKLIPAGSCDFNSFLFEPSG